MSISSGFSLKTNFGVAKYSDVGHTWEILQRALSLADIKQLKKADRKGSASEI